MRPGAALAGRAYGGRVRRQRSTSALLIALALLGGCGADDTAEEPGGARPTELADPLPKLPRGWEPYVNRSGGFALGRPPGWSARDEGATALLRSPDRLVAVTVSADRTSEALELPPERYARRVFRALAGYRGEPKPSAPARLRGSPYKGAQVSGEAVAAESGVRQDVRVAVLQRPELVTFTVVVGANARRASSAQKEDALRVARSVRSRPSGAPPLSP